jgi:hypothetical protein
MSVQFCFVFDPARTAPAADATWAELGTVLRLPSTVLNNAAQTQSFISTAVGALEKTTIGKSVRERIDICFELEGMPVFTV